jgi:hypothetical protein
MKLMTKELERRFAAVGRQEENPDPLVLAKWFTPDSNWTWWATEYDPEMQTCFGLVQGFEVELGYFSLVEMAEVHGAMGLGIERDLYWMEQPLSKVRAGIEKAALLAEAEEQRVDDECSTRTGKGPGALEREVRA